MAVITSPALRLRSVEWALDRPAQINMDISGKRTIDTAPLYGKWAASVELATYESESAFCPIRSFLVRLCGPVGTFQLPATVEAQNSNSGVTVASTAAAGAMTLVLDGAATPLFAGQMVTVNNQLLQLTEAAGTVIAFEPPLRAEARSGAAVETANPWALVYLTDPRVSWTVEPPQRFSTSFNVEEAVEGFALAITHASSLTESMTAAASLADEHTSVSVPPVFIAFDTHSTGGSLASAVPYPAGLQANDIALLQAWIDDFDGTTGTITAPSGWAEVAQGTANSLAFKRHAVFWKRLTGAESGTVEITRNGAGFGDGSSDTVAGAMSLWRGCVAAGDPFEAIATPTTGQSTSLTGSNVTTTGVNRTVVNFCACDDDTLSAPAAIWTEQYDYTSVVAVDHGLKCYSLEQATAGTVTAVSHTLAASERWSVISFALIPA